MAADESLFVTGKCSSDCSEWWCVDNGCPPGCWDLEAGCPPGCVEDTSGDEYPPGYPSVETCETIQYSTGQYDTFGRTCFKEINNRFWMGSEAKGQFWILNKDGTIHLKVVKPVIDGIVQIGSDRFGQYFTQFLDKVIVWSTTVIGANGGEDVMYVYDLDGNYLEYWQLPDGYQLTINGNISSSPMDANDTFFIISTASGRNPVYAYRQMFFWFDYYGTCFKIIEQDALVTADAMSINIMGDKLFCGNFFSRDIVNADYVGTAVVRNASDASFIKSLDRQFSPSSFDYFGSALKLITYKDGSQLMGVGMSFSELGTSPEDVRITNMKLYDIDGNFVKQLTKPAHIPADWDIGLGNMYYENGFHIYGDYMIVGAGYLNNPYAYTNDALGYVYITDLDGNIISEIGGFLPTPGKDDSLGFCVWMDRDYVYMFGGYNNNNTYLKKCNIKWAS